MKTKTFLIAAIALAAALGAAFAAKRFLCCSSSAPMAACEAPGGAVAIAGAPTGDYDRLQSLGCQMSCAKKDVPEGTVIAAQPGVAVGQTTTCPVSGVIFTASADSAAVTLEGRTYYACCAGCIEKLKAEPARFLRL